MDRNGIDVHKKESQIWILAEGTVSRDFTRAPQHIPQERRLG